MKISNNNINDLKIKLLIMNSPEINFRKMFYNCDSLKKFSIITKDEQKLKNKIIEGENDNQTDSLDINNSEEINKQSSINLYFFNKSNNKPEKIYERDDSFDFSDYKTKYQYIFNFSDKNDISKENKEQINQIIFQSNNILHPSSFDSVLFKSNIYEYKLINLNLFSPSTIIKRLKEKNSKENETNNLLEDIYSNLLLLDNLLGYNNKGKKYRK